VTTLAGRTSSGTRRSQEGNGSRTWASSASYRFPNGFGASVVNSQFITNGAPYELAVLKWHGEGERDFKLTYDTPVTCDVERGDADDVNGMLAAIAALETSCG